MLVSAESPSTARRASVRVGGSGRPRGSSHAPRSFTRHQRGAPTLHPMSPRDRLEAARHLRTPDQCRKNAVVLVDPGTSVGFVGEGVSRETGRARAFGAGGPVWPQSSSICVSCSYTSRFPVPGLHPDPPPSPGDQRAEAPGEARMGLGDRVSRTTRWAGWRPFTAPPRSCQSAHPPA